MPLRTCGRTLSALLLLVLGTASTASSQVTYTVNSTLDQIDDDSRAFRQTVVPDRRHGGCGQECVG